MMEQLQKNVSLDTLLSNSKHQNVNFTLENWACLIEGTNQQSNVRVDTQASCLHTNNQPATRWKWP